MSFLDLTGVELERKGKFTVIPEGDYDLACLEAEVKDTKAGNGRYIKAKFKVVGGDFDGRFIWDQWNFENLNAKAVQIAQQNILKFLTSAGLPKSKMILSNPKELEGLVGKAHVGIKEEKNEIKYWIIPDDATKPSSTSDYAKELGF